MAKEHARGAWQRNVIGASAVVLLAGAGLLFGGVFGREDGPDGLASSLLRMGLVMAVLWLAWPQAFRPSSLAILGSVLVTVLVVARFPKLFPLLLGGLIFWGLLRPRLWKALRG